MKLSEAITRNLEGYIIDGNYYEKQEIAFSEAELDIELEVITVEKNSKIAQGTVDGHHFIARVN